MVCVEYSVTEVCILDTETGELRDCEVTSTECVEWEYVGGGGGGGGDPPGGGGGGECCPIPPCEEPCFNPPGGGSEPVHDTTTIETENPCESANPPDYCDEAGSCYDKSIEDQYDRQVIRALENEGTLNNLWQKGNPEANDQSERRERGGWIVQNDDGSYDLVEFHEAESDTTYYTPLGIRGISTGNRPSGTVATFHTQPFEPDEVITDTEVIQQYLDENNLNDQYDAESVTFTYRDEPSEEDFATADSLSMKGYLIDGSTVYSYDDVNGVDTAVGRCGY